MTFGQMLPLFQFKRRKDSSDERAASPSKGRGATLALALRGGSDDQAPGMAARTPEPTLQELLVQLNVLDAATNGEAAPVYVVDEWGGHRALREVRLDWVPRDFGEADRDERHPIVEVFSCAVVHARLGAIRDLHNEVDCRIEHGADSGGHLEYVRDRLASLLDD